MKHKNKLFCISFDISPPSLQIQSISSKLFAFDYTNLVGPEKYVCTHAHGREDGEERNATNISKQINFFYIKHPTIFGSAHTHTHTHRHRHFRYFLDRNDGCIYLTIANVEHKSISVLQRK